MLLGEAIRGTSTFEWLDGRRFVIWRSHYDHSQIPDGITIIGITEGQLSMHYFDQRGVYRVYAVSLDQAKWRYWRDAPAPDFSQRFTGTFSDDGNTITGPRSAIAGREYLGGRSCSQLSEGGVSSIVPAWRPQPWRGVG